MNSSPSTFRIDGAVRAVDLAPPTLLAAGDWGRSEFRIAQSAVDARFEWPLVPTLIDAIDRIAGGDLPPELVLLAQPQPGLVTQADVDRLLTVAPLTRLVIVAGSWCEGELRTGRPVVGAVRLYWHEFAAWWRGAIVHRAAPSAPPWSAPLDEPRAGQRWRIDGPQRPLLPSSERRGSIEIDAADYAVFEALTAALAGEGWQTTWRPRRRPDAYSRSEREACIAGIFDAAQLDGGELEALAAFCQRVNGCGPPVVIALIDYPRVEHLAAASAVGAGAVIGKPYDVEMLMTELARLAATTRPPAQSG